MAGFLTAAASMIGGNAIVDSVVRIVIAYGVSRLINRNVAKDNRPGPAFTDEGVRLQIAPNTTNQIPILFGSAFYGGIITDAQLTNANRTMWYCITLSDVFGLKTDESAITTRFTNVYWNNQRVVFKADGVTIDYVINDDGVVDASARDLVKIYLYRNGSATPTQITDPETNNPVYGSFSGVDARTLMPGWTNDHKMSSLTFALVKLDYNRDKGITGLPDIKFNVRNDNYLPGNAIYSFLRNSRVGCDLFTSAIDVTSLNALNDYADDEITYLDADSTLKTLGDRYQINGLLNTADSVLTNLEKLCLSSGCYLNYDIAAGKWGVVINRDAEPSLDFDDSNIISGITVTGTALDGIYNGVEIEFPHRELRDQSDFVRIDLPSEYRNANEPDNTLKTKFEMLNEPLQARSLAYLELYQNRMDQVVTFTTDYSKINTEAGDIITVTNSVYDWDHKEFRVIRVKEVESDEGGIAVEITAQEYDATMYQAGGQPRRPGVPSEPIGIPTLGAIGTPSAPTIFQTNNQNAQPNIILRSVVPGSTQAGTSVIVDRMEFWYAEGTQAQNIPTSSYKLLEVSINANGNPFTTGSNQDSQPIITLDAGNYLFRVRAGNATGYSDYSAATALAWDPKQRADEVDENTNFTPESPDLSDLLGPLAMGAIAYFAYQALKPEILAALSQTDLGKLLGITDPAEIAAAQAAIEQQASAFRIINAGNASLSAIGDNTVTFIAGDGIEITAVDVGHEITISATGGGGGGNSFTSIAIAGQSTVVADSATDTLTLVAGTGISLASDPTTDTITINATGGGGGGGGASFGNVAVAGQSTVVAEIPADTLTLVAGTGISLSTNAAADSITINATGGGGGGGGGTTTGCENAPPPDLYFFRLGDTGYADIADFREDHNVNYLVSILLPASNTLRNTFPITINGEMSIFTHQAFVIGTSDKASPPFYSGVWGGSNASWPAPDDYGLQNFRSVLYDDNQPLKFGGYIYRTTIATEQYATYYTICNFDSTKSFEAQSWSDWIFASGTNGSAAASVTKTLKDKFCDNVTLTFPSLGSYNSTTGQFRNSWPKITKCQIIMIGLAYKTGAGTNWPATVPYSQRTIFGRQVGEATQFSYPGFSTTPTLTYLTLPGSNRWELRAYQEDVKLSGDNCSI